MPTPGAGSKKNGENKTFRAGLGTNSEKSGDLPECGPIFVMRNGEARCGFRKGSLKSSRNHRSKRICLILGTALKQACKTNKKR
ncbi:MAG: hypothetical protein D6714_08195 [Bacteroidetes bacterium]|nr:MAG: hypothetical protein D6714_08195 [Bacteroidota bacterium]